MIALNENQKHAVECEDKNILVVAAPGSGKTRIITERAAYLIENKKVSAHELVLVTFTRLAAKEMRTRLEERIGEKARHITIGTFHSIALRLLRRFGDLVGIRANSLTVYSEWESEYLLKEIAVDMGIYNGKQWKVKKGVIDNCFEQYYDFGIEPDETHPAYKIFKEFCFRMRENNSLSYGSLLIGLKLLIPHIKNYLHWKHIFCDESHDNVHTQWQIIKDLQEGLDASLFIVSDPDQSIYGFRNATPQWIIDHQHEFTLIKLENNYRSVPEIVEASNRLISHNSNRIDKTMRAVRDGKEIYEPIIVFNDMDSKAIAANLTHFTDKKPAVLSRVHILLDKLSQELTAIGVPHEKIGRKTALTNSEEFRRFHAFLKLTVNPYDNFSFMLIRESLDVLREEYAIIRLKATQEGKSHFQVYLEKDFRLVSWGVLAGMSLEEIAEAARPYSEDICNFILDYLKEHDRSSIEDYLEWLATYDLQDEIAEDTPNKIQLMTVFAAKGLEFDTVFLIGCNEGIMPSKQAIAANNEEEERRIYYVGMTRAKDRLILCVRPESSVNEQTGKEYKNPISRFIGEAGL